MNSREQDHNATAATGQPLEGRIALVTGASRGIGRAVAIELGRRGAHVIIQGRVKGALEETDDAIQAAGGAKATLLPLNLTQSEKVDGVGPTLFQRFGRLDLLIANAGVLGPLSPLGHVTDQGWDDTLAVNLTANWRLIRTLDPLLKRSDGARVVFVTSGAARGEKAYWGPYAVSKAGIEALARTYAAEVVNSTIRVNIVNPGATATQMRAKAMPGEDPATLPAPADIAPLFADLCDPSETRNGVLIDARDWLAARTS